MLNAISPIAAPAGGAVASQAITATASAPLTPTGESLAASATGVASATPDSIAVRLGRELQEARSLEMQAREAVTALNKGDRTDVEGVLLATRKADAAFQMLQAVRNAMMQAYAEIRDMRV